MDEKMYHFLERQGRLPKWARFVRVGKRYLLVDERMLPCLDLLPHEASRQKGEGGRTMISRKRKKLASKIEVPIYDAILLAAFLDVLAAKVLRDAALAVLAEMKRPKKGRPAQPDPVVERLAKASVERLPRLTSS